MKEIAYQKLIESINNNELELFFRTDRKYLVVDHGDRGMNFDIDYYAMAFAVNKYISESPNGKKIIKEAIIKGLKSSKLGCIRTLIEMSAYQLRYSDDDLGFLDEEILIELKHQIKLHSDEFLNNSKYNYEELDEIVYETSGKHIL